MANYPQNYIYQPTPQQCGVASQPMQSPMQGQTLPPQQMGQPMAWPRIAVRQVASEMEAVSIPTPFDGSILILTDLGHGMIYVKALNCNDGTAIFERFGRQAPPAPAPAVEYAPLDMVQQLQRQVAALETASAPKQAAKSGQKEAVKT